jgi:hypothetical protein
LYWQPQTPHFHSDKFFHSHIGRASYNLIYPDVRIKGGDVFQGHSKYPLVTDSKNNTFLKFKKLNTEKDKSKFEQQSKKDPFNLGFREETIKLLQKIKVSRVEMIKYIHPYTVY